MKFVDKVLPALLIAAGIFFLGIFIKSGIDNFSNRDRIVTVRGLAEKEVKANKVTWPIVYKVVGNDLATLYATIEANNRTVSNFLTGNKVNPDEILMRPPTVVDLQAERYGNNDRPYRFIVSQVIVVTSTDVDKVNSLITRQTELLKQGIALVTDEYSNQTIYEYTSLNEVKPGMIAEATHNAREAANKFAADSESRLGKIKTASQGQFSIEDRDPYTPYIKKIRVVSTIVYYLED